MPSRFELLYQAFKLITSPLGSVVDYLLLLIFPSGFVCRIQWSTSPNPAEGSYQSIKLLGERASTSYCISSARVFLPYIANRANSTILWRGIPWGRFLTRSSQKLRKSHLISIHFITTSTLPYLMSVPINQELESSPVQLQRSTKTPDGPLSTQQTPMTKIHMSKRLTTCSKGRNKVWRCPLTVVTAPTPPPPKGGHHITTSNSPKPPETSMWTN